MRVFIQSNKDGLPHNSNFFKAYEGFLDMGAEIVPFEDAQDLQISNPEDIIVGYIDPTRTRLHQLGFETPELDYPKSIAQYLGRRIWKSNINTISCHPEVWPVFVKSVEDKLITGKVVGSIHDLIGCGESQANAEVYCSEVLKFRAEWRAFVRYGKILDVRPYRGDWHVHYDAAVIDACVSDYHDIPAGCSLDFGVTDDGRTLLIEVNDGYALGCYGLHKYLYAKLLSARWAELTATEDMFNF